MVSVGSDRKAIGMNSFKYSTKDKDMKWILCQ